MVLPIHSSLKTVESIQVLVTFFCHVHSCAAKQRIIVRTFVSLVGRHAVSPARARWFDPLCMLVRPISPALASEVIAPTWLLSLRSELLQWREKSAT